MAYLAVDRVMEGEDVVCKEAVEDLGRATGSALTGCGGRKDKKAEEALQ
jgi:hypothetical protein